MSRRRRGLSPADREVWGRVARSVDPLRPEGPAPAGTAVPVPPAPPEPAPLPLAPFRVGERAQTASSAHGAAPAMADGQLRMDGRTHRRMRRGKLEPEGRIDLHGLTLARAQPALTDFVRSSHAAGRRLVLVITGKGRADDAGHGGDWTGRRPGALRRQVPMWLAGPALGGIVQQVTPAHRRHGGDGALYVYLRRAR